MKAGQSIQGEQIVNPASSEALTENFSVSGNEAVEKAQYTTQYALGAFFNSQNGGLWTENQKQDLTFKLYKAKFTSQSGGVLFNNPELDESNDYVKKLNSNPVRTLPRTGKIGIQTSNTLTTELSAGRKIASLDNNRVGTAVITGTGASCVTVSVLEGLGGANYIVDQAGTGGVETFAIEGKGTGLKLSIDSVDANGLLQEYQY